jgi:transcriptional regulator with XRE-family HTH domain
MTFGQRLASIRQVRGLSQSELAAKTGLEPSAVSHFETGRRLPSMGNLKVLCDALDISADYLIGRLK